MNAKPDYYRILHVQRDAPGAVITASYRTLMQKLKQHPDLGGDSARAALLNEAYAVLGSEDSRAAYDRERDMDPPGAAGRHGEAASAAPCHFCGTPYRTDQAPTPADRCTRCHSPLFPAARHRLDPSGQRMLMRIARQQPMMYYTDWRDAKGIAAQMCDLSLNGLQLRTERRLEAGRLLRIDCEVLQALARVAHCRRDAQIRGKWLVGTEFVTLSFARSAGSFVSADV